MRSTQTILNDAVRERMPGSISIRDRLHDHRSMKDPLGACPPCRVCQEGMMTNFAKPDAYPVDGRGVAYSMAYFSAKHLGYGAILPDDHRGQSGKPLDGGSTYRLTCRRMRR